MFWDKIRSLFRKKAEPKCVYAGPEYFERLNRGNDGPDQPAEPESTEPQQVELDAATTRPAEPKCVYAGPEYFKRRNRKRIKTKTTEEPIIAECVYAGPEPAEPEIPELEIAAPVYAGPPLPEEPEEPEIPEELPEREEIRKPTFGRVYAGPAFYGKRRIDPKRSEDPGRIAQPVYAAPVPRSQQQSTKGERKKYPDPDKDVNDIEEVYAGPGMMGEI